MRRILLILLFLIFIAYGSTHRQIKRPLTEKELSWVLINSVNYNVSDLDYEAEAGSVDILYDQQMFPENNPFSAVKL